MTDDITSDDIMKLNDDLKADYRSKIDVFEWKYGKTCLSCKHEPEWEEFKFYIGTENNGCSYGKGHCRYPMKIPLLHTVNKEPLYNLISGDVQLFCSTIGTPISLLFICEAWEAK